MNYKKITAEDIKIISNIVDKEHIFTREKISEDYAHDELSGTYCFPDLLVEVSATEQVSTIMKYASEIIYLLHPEDRVPVLSVLQFLFTAEYFLISVQ